MSDAIDRFITMARMGLPEIEESPRGLATIRRKLVFQEAARENLINLTKEIRFYPESFPIVASTFAALTIERPELLEHYERARQAWEASQ